MNHIGVAGKALCFAGGALLFVGCASGTVKHDPDAQGATAKVGVGTYSAPAALCVGSFNVQTGKWGVEEGPKRQAQQAAFKAAVEYGLVERLAELAPTSGYGGRETRGWLIEGETLQVDPGNALLRGLIGMGAGQSKAKVRVRIYDLASDKKLIRQFIAYADSGAGIVEPGGAIAMAATGSELNAARICREIRDEIKRMIRK